MLPNLQIIMLVILFFLSPCMHAVSQPLPCSEAAHSSGAHANGTGLWCHAGEVQRSCQYHRKLWKLTILCIHTPSVVYTDLCMCVKDYMFTLVYCHKFSAFMWNFVLITILVVSPPNCSFPMQPKAKLRWECFNPVHAQPFTYWGFNLRVSLTISLF